MQKNAKILTSKECIKLVSQNSANIINSSIVDSTLLDNNITPYTKFLEFLHNNQINQQATRSFECTEDLDHVREYLEDTKSWYSFLNALYEKLSDYKIQKNTGTCNNLTHIISTQYKENTKVADINLEPFPKQCYQQYEYNAIKNIMLSQSKLNALNKVLSFTLSDKLDQSCNPNKLVLKGHYVKLSDINTTCKVQFIEIFALNTVFIDSDLDKTGKKVSMAIIAPTWDIQGRRKITLDGANGVAHNPVKASNGVKQTSENGKPGLPGGLGGNLLGIGKNIINAKDLSISANGGKGGPGQHGADGAQGQNGHEFPNSLSRLDEIDKELSSNNYQYVLSEIEGLVPAYGEAVKVVEAFDYTIYGKDGSLGYKGGDGGHGGKPGNAGQVRVIVPMMKTTSHININAHAEEEGDPGIGGVGGPEGSAGTTLTIQTNRYEVRVTDRNVYSHQENKVKEVSISGRKDTNITGIDQPEVLGPFYLANV